MRLFGNSDKRHRARLARLGTIGVLGIAATTVLGVAGAVPATAAGAGITASAQSTGLQLVLFGTKLTGGNASACVNDVGSPGATTPVANKNGDGTASLCDQQPGVFSASEGEGTLLTSSGIHEDQKATEAQVGQTNGSTSSTCAQGGGTPAGTPVLLTLGLSCTYSEAAIDSTGNPWAAGMGEVASLHVGLNGILSPLLGASPSTGSGDSCNNTGTVGALLNTLCTALSSLAGNAPAPANSLFAGINQALQNLYNVVVNNLDNTVEVEVGQATSCVTTSTSSAVPCAPSLSSTSGTLAAVSKGSTLDVKVLPGVGCAAPPGDTTQPTLAQCIADAVSPHPQFSAPLIEVTVSEAQSTSIYNGTTWSSTGSGSLADVDINIPGAQQTIALGPNIDQTLLAGTPLQTTIDLGSAQTGHSSTGASSNAQGAVINVLQSSTFPGASNTVGAVSANLGSTGTGAAQQGSAPPPTSPAGGTTPAAPAVAAAGATSPTAVHTGEWFAGSMPLLVGIGLLGAGLIGWPRFRRFAFVSRFVSRVHR